MCVSCGNSGKNEDNPDRHSRIENLLDEAEATFSLNDISALRYCRKAIRLSVENENKNLTGKSYLYYGTTLKNLNRPVPAKKSFETALEYLSDGGDKELLAACYSRLAQIHLDNCDYLQAYELFTKGREIAEKISSIKVLKQIYTNIAVVFTKIGNYNKALEYTYKAIELYDEENNEQQYLLIHNNVASLYNEYGKHDKALEVLNKIIGPAADLNDSFATAIIYSELADVYMSLDSISKAKESIEISYNHIIPDQRFFPVFLKAYIMASKGRIFKKSNMLDSALIYLEKARKIYAENGHISGESDVLSDMASIAAGRKDYKLAKRLLFRSNDHALDVNYRRLASLNYEQLSEIYLRENNPEKALEYYKKHIALKDSLYNEKSNNKLMDLQISYETRKKEQENTSLRDMNSLQRNYFIAFAVLLILLIIVMFSRYKTKKKSLEALTGKNKIISAQNKDLDTLNNQLAEANATKDKFFLILSHELLNPVKWLDNVAKMLRDNYKNMPPEEIDRALAALWQSSSTSSQLLENLLTWSKIQVGRIELTKTNVRVYELIDELKNVFLTKLVEKKIGVSNNVDKDIILKTDRNMLYTVLRNVIDNAIKFSHENGEVLLWSEQENETLCIIVKDQGTGIKEADKSRIFDISKSFSTFGTKREKGSGIGLILCREYMNYAGGDIRIDSQEGKGTEIRLEIPLGTGMN